MQGKLVKPIKVLHVVGGMNAAGIETLIMNLYRNIDLEKIQFDFAVHTDQKCFYDDEIIQLGGSIISLPKPDRKNLSKYKRSLKDTIIEHGPYDAIHSHVLFFSGIVLSVANKLNIPVRIAHSHSINDSKGSTILRKLYRESMRRKVIKNASHLLGCSSKASEYLFGKSTLRLGYPIHFPNGINVKKYKDLNLNKDYLISELNLPLNTTVIGHIGRFSKPKNHKFIIRLFSHYLEKNPDAHLILVGEGEERVNIERLVMDKKLHNNIHFLGLRNDIECILSSIDLFLFPSLYEGLGIVLIEAQAAGVPCLTSDVIPHEADLKIGLMNKLNLSENLDKWVMKIEYSLKTDKLSWNEIEPALVNSGYDIKSATNKLYKIYSGEQQNEG